MPKQKTKSAYESREEYARKSYDRLLLQMPKGAREQIAAKAAAAGVSTSRYILEAVESRSGLKLTLDNGLPWLNSETKK
jgi:hypothetical protein